MRYLLSTTRGVGPGFSVAPSAGHTVVPGSSQRPQRGHSIIGGVGVSRVSTRGRRLACWSAAAAAQARDVEPEPHLRRDAREQLEILGRVRLFGALLAEHERADERAILPEHRDQQRRARSSPATRSPPAAAAAPAIADRPGRSPAARPTTAASSPGRRRAPAAPRSVPAPSPATSRPSSMPLARMAVTSGCSAWSICSTTSDARSPGSVSKRTRPASDTQDLPRVVLLAEEPLVEPLARAVAVAHDAERRDEQQQVDDRAARDDLHAGSSAAARRPARRRAGSR